MQKRKLIGFISLAILFFGTVGSTSMQTTDNSENLFYDLFDGFMNIWDIQEVSGADSDTSTGSFLLDSTPVASSVDFVDSAYSLTSTLTSDDSTIFGVNFTITHSATMADLLNVTVLIFDDSVHGADPRAGSPDGYQLIQILWTESDANWVIDQGALSQWTMQSPVDPGIAGSETVFEFCARFDMSKITRADSDWNASVWVFDDDGTPDWTADSETGLVTVSNYYEVTYSTSTFDWGGGVVESNAVNVTHDVISVDVICNNDYELTILGSDFTASAETPIDLDVTDCLAWDEDGSAGGDSFWVRNSETIGLGAWGTISAPTSESANTVNIYVLLSTDTFFDAGIGKTWSSIITIQAQADT